MSGNTSASPVIAVPNADAKLYNHDLAPVAPAGRTWGVFSIFAMWMSDVHSVGGYTFAASLFFLGSDRLASADRDGCRHHGRLFPDEPDRPAVADVRHPVPGGGAHVVRRDGRQPRGRRARHRRHRLVRRADLFRLEGRPGAGLDAVPSGARSADPQQLHRACPRWAGSASCSCGSSSFVIFLSGMETIRKFIDFCGPAVYVVMFALAIWILTQTGFSSLSLQLSPPAPRDPRPRHDGQCGDADRGLFRGAAAQLRRLRALCAKSERGDEDRQLPRPAGQLPRVLRSSP